MFVASRIEATQGRLEAIRYLRRLGLTYQTAAKTVTEIQQKQSWARRAIKRGAKMKNR